MKPKRIVQIDIRSGKPLISIFRVPGAKRTYIAGLKSFDRVVRVCAMHPHFGWEGNGFDRWVSTER